MIEAIYIYTELWDQKPADYTADLEARARELGLSVPIRVFGLEGEDIFYEAEAAKAIADFLQTEAPGIVLIPAVPTAKAIFARAAVLLNVGMTADCTQLYMEDGVFKQKKPAFGNEMMVITEESTLPALVTVVAGNSGKASEIEAESVIMLHADRRESAQEILGMAEQESDEIVDAEVILSIGRGIDGEEGYKTAEALAKKLGAAIGGTRPLVDQGTLPFEHQIGQTGCVVHPKCCIFAGVSGAIQHTEGVRDTNVTIAVNSDPNAAIFSFADYGVIADGTEFMQKLMENI